MRISDWSSDVCSSDLHADLGDQQRQAARPAGHVDGGIIPRGSTAPHAEAMAVEVPSAHAVDVPPIVLPVATVGGKVVVDEVVIVTVAGTVMTFQHTTPHHRRETRVAPRDGSRAA